MRTARTRALVALVIVGCTLFSGLAAPGGSDRAAAVGPPDTPCALALMSVARAVPRWLEDCGTVRPDDLPEVAARQALSALEPVLGLRADGQDLAVLTTRQEGDLTHVRFAQRHNGVAVYLGQVLVAYDQAGQVRLVNNHTLPNLAVDVRPQLDGDAATAIALDTITGADHLRQPVERELVIYAEGVAPTLAWQVVIAAADPAADWHVMVSAVDGAVIASWDELQHDSGSGRAYRANAVQRTGDTGLRDIDDATSASLDAARVDLPLNHLDNTTFQLRGSAVDATGAGVTGCTLPYVPGSANEASRIYNYTRDDDRFEEVTAYSVIDGAQSWFQSLGFNNANNRAIPIDVHCDSVDNSYFSDGDGALHFGDGGVDDAEDTDIVLHEYGHAVQADIVPGWGPGQHTEQRAMGEGFGDLLAGMYLLNSGDAGYLANYKYCIGEWDATSYNPVVAGNPGTGCLRWINGRNEGTGADIGAYSGTPTQEHNDGRFWSSAMTCIFEGLGGNTAARNTLMSLVLAHTYHLLPDLSNAAFDDSINALLLVDRHRYAGANRALIASCAQQRLSINANATAPTTTASLAPTPNGAGWNTTAVTVTLTATDDVGGPGIARITYSASGAQVIDTTHVVSATATIDITAEGVTTISYFATDKAGNAEPVRTRKVRIDATRPTNTAPRASLNTRMNANGTIPYTLSWTATDPSGGSGLGKTYLQRSVNSGAFTPYGLSSSTATSATINLASNNTYRFRTLAADVAGNKSRFSASQSYAWGPSFSVRARQDSDTSGAVSFAGGTWAQSSQSDWFGGTSRYATKLGASVTVHFTGTQIAWIGSRGSNRGQVSITLDGVAIYTAANPLDLYRSTASSRMALFRRTGLSNTSHTLVITIVGKNSSSLGRRVDFDGAVFLRLR